MCGVLTRIVVTCTGILTSERSTMGHPFGFIANGTLSYRWRLKPRFDLNARFPRSNLKFSRQPAVSARRLTPIIFGARTLDE